MKILCRLYKILDRISDILQKPLEFMSALFLFGGLLALFFQVLYRYVIVKFTSFSFPFTEEFARYTIVAFTYLSCGVSLKEGGMISLNILSDRLPKMLRIILYFTTRVLMIIFFIVVIKYGFLYLPTALRFRSVMLNLPGVYLYTLPMVGCVLMGYETLVEALGVICGEVQSFGNRLKIAAQAELSSCVASDNNSESEGS